MFYVDMGSNMAIVEACTLASAWKKAKAEWGSYFVLNVRPATEEEVAWFKAMDGHLIESQNK